MCILQPCAASAQVDIICSLGTCLDDIPWYRFPFGRVFAAYIGTLGQVRRQAGTGWARGFLGKSRVCRATASGRPDITILHLQLDYPPRTLSSPHWCPLQEVKVVARRHGWGAAFISEGFVTNVIPGAVMGALFAQVRSGRGFFFKLLSCDWH